jgi:23S rRNA (cytidine1920-2'-O)/16S rRNA (cytidine1409-2'-O)-methyltransferase
VTEKVRLDVLVQERAGVSRSKAQGLIRTGQVRDAGGDPLKKPGERFLPDIPLQILEGPRYVSRGGEKLEGALEGFGIDVNGVIALDAGASTGGFTDCLLQHGAAKVYAVDVGYGQLAWSLRQDPRVVVMERCNVRYLTSDQLDDTPDFFVVDCSFISLKKILPPIVNVLGENPSGVALIKPQFEAGKDQVGKGGVVRDDAVREAVVADVVETARELGFTKIDVIPSPLLGPAGNREFLAWLRAYKPA